MVYTVLCNPAYTYGDLLSSLAYAEAISISTAGTRM